MVVAAFDDVVAERWHRVVIGWEVSFLHHCHHTYSDLRSTASLDHTVLDTVPNEENSHTDVTPPQRLDQPPSLTEKHKVADESTCILVETGDLRPSLGRHLLVVVVEKVHDEDMAAEAHADIEAVVDAAGQ